MTYITKSNKIFTKLKNYANFFFSGPIVSALINRFGIRPLVVIGGFGQAVAYILSGLAPSLFTFTLSFGLLIGLSFYIQKDWVHSAVQFFFDRLSQPTSLERNAVSQSALWKNMLNFYTKGVNYCPTKNVLEGAL